MRTPEGMRARDVAARIAGLSHAQMRYALMLIAHTDPDILAHRVLTEAEHHPKGDEPCNS